jgi:hypothetical protein
MQNRSFSNQLVDKDGSQDWTDTYPQNLSLITQGKPSSIQSSLRIIIRIIIDTVITDIHPASAVEKIAKMSIRHASTAHRHVLACLIGALVRRLDLARPPASPPLPQHWSRALRLINGGNGQVT